MTSGPFGWLPLYDDAYITLTSAQAIWTGTIPNYSGTPPLHGVTSPVHVALVAMLLLIASPMTALWWSQVVGAAVYVNGLWRLVRVSECPRWQALAITIIGVIVGMTPYHLFNGLETGLALGAVTWTLAITQQPSRWGPVLYGILPFVRPELALLSIACTAWILWKRPRETWFTCAAWIGLGALPWMVFLWLYGDTILPASASAKAAFVADRCWTVGLKGLILIWAVKTWLLALGLASVGVIGLCRPGLPRLCGAVLVLALVSYAAGLPSHMLRYQHQRYLYLWSPLVLLGVIALIRSRRKLAPIGVTLILAASAVQAPFTWHEAHQWHSAFRAEQQALDTWLSLHVPKASRLLVTDAGYLAYSTDYRLIDAIGLKSPSSMPVHMALTLPSCGQARGTAMALIAEATHPEYLVTWTEWETASHMSDQMRSAGWHADAIRPRPNTAHDDWWYSVFRISGPRESSQD